MKTNLPIASRPRVSRRRRQAVLTPQAYSLMSIPFPVFVTNEKGKVVPTITLPEFAQITRYQE
ncbi:MAG: hypothetical protein B9S32_10535 [Verrucomicrobia bacterium Tous-C9LFEB]|nr:MAG: hypothetical protein B9S32_10535 [Verrucomicrobia bacterium Tous-C9LFEB]